MVCLLFLLSNCDHDHVHGYECLPTRCQSLQICDLRIVLSELRYIISARCKTHRRKMKSVQQGRVSKRDACRKSCQRCSLLEAVNFILRKQMEQKAWRIFLLNQEKKQLADQNSFKIFQLDERNRQLDEYCQYLEDIVNNSPSLSPEMETAKEESNQEPVEESNMSNEDYSEYLENIANESHSELEMETQQEAESCQPEPGLQAVIKQHSTNVSKENERYWQCFWCLKQYGCGQKPCSTDYTAHLTGCFGRKTFEKFYQQDHFVCESCNGVKVMYLSTSGDMFDWSGCVLCMRDKITTNDKRHLAKHRACIPFTLCLSKIPLSQTSIPGQTK